MSDLDRNALYEQEFAALEALCRDFITAREGVRILPVADDEPDPPSPDIAQLLLCGMMTAQCARLYNLAPPAGFLDPRTLFTGRPE